MDSAKNRLLLYAMALLQGMVFYAPVATLYRQAAGVTVFQITVIEAVSLTLALVLELPWGVAADRLGYRRTLVLCSFLYLLSKLIFWQASGFWGFLLERILLAVVLSGISGCDVTLLYLSCPPGQSHRAFSLYHNLCSLGLLLSALVYSAFVGTDYRLAGLLTVFSYGAAFLLSLGLTEPPPAPGATPRPTLGLLLGALRDPGLLLFLLSVSCLEQTHQFVTVFLNQLQYQRSGIPPAAMGGVFVVVNLLGLLGVFSQGLTRRLGVLPSALLLFGGSALCCWVLAATARPFLSVACIALLRLCFNLFAPLQTELQNRFVTTSSRAAALSVNALLLEGTAAGANLLFGAASRSGPVPALVLGAFLCLAGGGLFALWYCRSPRSR